MEAVKEIGIGSKILHLPHIDNFVAVFRGDGNDLVVEIDAMGLKYRKALRTIVIALFRRVWPVGEKHRSFSAFDYSRTNRSQMIRNILILSID